MKITNHSSTCDILTRHFPNCRRILGDITWDGILAALGKPSPESFIQFLDVSGPDPKEQLKDIVPYIYDLACVEQAIFKLSNKEASDLSPRESVFVNPDLMLVPVSWKHLPDSMTGYGNKPRQKPEPEEGYVLIWRDPITCHLMCRDATDDDLLALKLVVEEIDFETAARRGKTSRAKILAVFHHAVNEGILINPRPLIRRNPELFTDAPGFASYLVSDSFTLQWHITQACDLHCRHCYDRSKRHSIPFSKALKILDDFFAFTLAAHVRGHISFTGGNPLLYPDFENLYYEASQRGFSLAILGNPAQKESIARLQEIQPLTHYQISLEGLEEYNDYIRG
ncbi:MAG: Selenobiotic family peptide radical maturase, partial [Thermodesulfobacteriota bacterium]|nr:Selenobiotic family peptide radical maturase [Thermodesulfobacteriota bacterium]